MVLLNLITQRNKNHKEMFCNAFYFYNEIVYKKNAYKIPLNKPKENMQFQSSALYSSAAQFIELYLIDIVQCRRRSAAAAAAEAAAAV